jgi:hypothetical protein
VFGVWVKLSPSHEAVATRQANLHHIIMLAILDPEGMVMNKVPQNLDLSKTREKSDLQKLETQQTFFNTLFMQSAREEEVAQQHIMDRFAELAKEQKFSKIKYDQIRKTNEIKRREGKKGNFREDKWATISPTRAAHRGIMVWELLDRGIQRL